VHHRSAGEIEDAHVLQPPPLTPDPVTEGIVDEGRPQQAEEQEALEADALHEGARDQGGRDDGEHHLEGGKEALRDRLGVVRVGRGIDALEPDEIQAADESVDRAAEGKRVPVGHPLHPDEGHEDVAQGQRGEDVLPADHAAVKKREARRHHEDQSAGDQNPGRIARVDLWSHDFPPSKWMNPMFARPRPT